MAGFAHDVIRRIAEMEVENDVRPYEPSVEELSELCEVLVDDSDTSQARDLIARLDSRASAETISVIYLAAAARMLGEWWLSDRASFVEVTVGVGRIFEILRELRTIPKPVFEKRDVTVIFAAVPGEQHTLGVRMATDLFRGDGWEVTLKVGLTQKELVDDIAQRQRCIVGLSISGAHSLPALTSLLGDLQKFCPHAATLVCGQSIAEIKPQLSSLGVAAIAGTLEEAKESMSALWDREMSRL